jgi:hypothetical protein
MSARTGREPELLLLVVFGAMSIAGAVWMALKLPTPRCLFHDATGLPCLGCGGTRSMRSLFAGDVASAWAWNPLVFLTVVACGMVGLYAFAVVCGGISPIRIGRISNFHAAILRAAVVATLAANWIYLISRGV